MEQELVTVHVGTGDDLKEWKIHKNVLIEKSPFFAAALEPGRWLETQGEEAVVHLEEADPTAFSFVVEWMYQGTIGTEEVGDMIKSRVDAKLVPLKMLPNFNLWYGNREAGEGFEAEKGMFGKSLSEVREELDARALVWIELWKLADFLNMPKLANIVMLRLITEFDPKKPKHEGGYNFLPLVAPCYDDETTNQSTPVRTWIRFLFAAGLAKIQKPGADYEDSYSMMEDYQRVLFGSCGSVRSIQEPSRLRKPRLRWTWQRLAK